MTEVISPIPARLKNIATGGHVAGAVDIIDDNTGETLDQLSLKPASTGTTGDNPYNGLGRVVLKKNIVNGVNTLTQDMLYKGAVGSRVPNTNTIFVIRYDFVLSEDITIPANCVLQFEGGGISGNYKVISTNTTIVGLLPSNPDNFYGTFYHDGRPLNYNLKVTKPLKSSLQYAFMCPAQYVGYYCYPQTVVSFYYSSNKYYLMSAYDIDSTPERTFFLLFDSDFAFKGSNESPYSCHGNMTYANNKLYVSRSINNNVTGIAVYNISEIVTKCISEYSNTPHSDTYTNKPQSIDFIESSYTIFDYDSSNNEFLAYDSSQDRYYIFDEEFSQIRQFNVNNEIENYLNNTGFKYNLEGGILKNGIVHINYWVHDYPSSDAGNNILLSYDTVNEAVLSFEKISVIVASSNVSGLCKDADDDNILYSLAVISVKISHSSIIGIQALSQVSDIYGIGDKKESNSNLINSTKGIDCYVDSSYDYSHGRADGSELKPYKTLDEALSMQVYSGKENVINIKDNGVNYYIPRISTGDGTLQLKAYNEDIPTIVGSFWAYGSQIRLFNIKLIGNYHPVLYSSGHGFIFLGGCEIYGSKTEPKMQGIMVVDCSCAKFEGSTVFKNCNIGINIGSGSILSGVVSTDNCTTGLYINGANTNIQSASFKDADTCISVDESKVNINQFTDISATGCTQIIAKRTVRGEPNFVFGITNATILGNFLQNFLALGTFNSQSMAIILPNDTEYNGLYLSRGKYTYTDPNFRDDRGYDRVTITKSGGVVTASVKNDRGSDTQRPTLGSSIRVKGFEYFDTTLNKPIYWTGTGWVDATGTPV